MRCFFYKNMAVLERHLSEKRLAIPQLLQRERHVHQLFSLPMMTVISRGGEEKNARQAWLEGGTDPAAVDQLLSSDGEWIYHVPVEKITNILKLPLQQFLSAVLDMLELPYAPVQHHLNYTSPAPEFGFNDHRLNTHIRMVVKEGMKLLLDSGFNDESEQMKLAILSFFIHDWGNCGDRTDHPINLEELMMKMTGKDNFEGSPLEGVILDATLHDETVALPILDEVLKQTHDGELPNPYQINHQAFLARYAAVVPHGAAVLRIADKVFAADYSRTFRNIPLQPHALDLDPHFLAATFLHFVQMGRQPNNIFRIEFNFSQNHQGLLAEHPELAVPKTARDGQKIGVPQNWKSAFAENDPSTFYFNRAQELFWQLHLKRVRLIVCDTFRVFPDIQNIEIAFTDQDKFCGRDRSDHPVEVYKFNRDSFFVTLDQIKKATEAQAQQ